MSETNTYFMTSDDELSRLANQHDVFKDEMGSLVLAPVDFSAGPLRILDSATADGTWLRDLQSSLPATPAHTFVGIDKDPTKFPAVPPKNTEFHVQDINLPWPADWHNSYDLVHQRLALAGAGPHGRATLHSMTELVKPGGWIQLVEATTADFESNGPAARLFPRLIRDVFALLGGSVNMAQQMSDWLGDAPGGFVDIQDRLVDVKLGAVNPDPKLAKQGAYSTSVGARQLVAFAKTFPPGGLSMTTEELDAMDKGLLDELMEKGAVFQLRVVWARKAV
ncbi:hypothetical protein FQN55_003438 [Onygenales sp. PD_40]|nr:hypothetical protein FQN55_003438 [Onygenales sp. PD_40]